MAEKISPGPLCGNPPLKEAVCIHTRKVYDSCCDKECLRDLRVYLTRTSQEVLNASVSVKPNSAELLWTYIDVEPITYNRGYYTVDVKYFYRIVCDAFIGIGRPRQIVGLATYDKRTVLFGSEGSARVFSSSFSDGAMNLHSLMRSNLPIGIVEAVDPLCLACKVVDCGPEADPCMDVPAEICNFFEEPLVTAQEGRQLYVTLGQFSIIKLERNIQLLMPAYDFCMPDKSAVSSAEDPCALFRNFHFPVDEFYPPQMDSEPADTDCGGCACRPKPEVPECGCCCTCPEPPRPQPRSACSGMGKHR